MRIVQGTSRLTAGAGAVAEATAGWPTGADAPQVILAFCSTRQPASEVARALSERHPGSLVVGCTTAGEILGCAHSNGGLVAMGISTGDVRFSAALVRGLSNVTREGLGGTVDGLLASIGASRDSLDPTRHFSLLFIDGLSRREESFVGLLDGLLGGIPLVGGSAGDDLRFERTEVFLGGEAASDAAVVVVGASDAPFTVLKHQHFLRTPKALVVTGADPDERVVREIDGLPAAEAYARALGVPPSTFTEEMASAHPLTLRIDGRLYVRSVRQVLADGGIAFFCAIEEGMVLEIGAHEDMLGALEREIRACTETLGQVDLFIASNCILRSLEASKAGTRELLGRALGTLSPHVIGFDTYGEQTGGLHVNQTLVGIAFGRRKAA